MTEFTTERQVSAGGVVFRENSGSIEVALVSVGHSGRWQLPKGIVEKDEDSRQAARREVREEAGLETEIIAPIDKIEYWYFGSNRSVRYHKFVYFFLLRYLSGDVADHDHEVNEARWVEIGAAQQMLAFENEKKVVAKAQEMIANRVA